MESSGMANKIQASEVTVKILEDEFAGEFYYELRGEMDVPVLFMQLRSSVNAETESNGSERVHAALNSYFLA